MGSAKVDTYRAGTSIVKCWEKIPKQWWSWLSYKLGYTSSNIYNSHSPDVELFAIV